MTKNNGKIKIIIAIVTIFLTLVGVVISVAKSYFILPIEVSHLAESNDKDHKEFKTDIEGCQDWMSQTGAELVGIKKDIGFLGEKIDRNSVIQQQILTEIKEINR